MKLSFKVGIARKNYHIIVTVIVVWLRRRGTEEGAQDTNFRNVAKCIAGVDGVGKIACDLL